LYTEPSFKNISTKQTVINNLRKLLFRINKRFCMKTLAGIRLCC
jgi:hypothetical protein